MGQGNRHRRGHERAQVGLKEEDKMTNCRITRRDNNERDGEASD